MIRHLLVGNPAAQSGRAEERIQEALAAMRRRGWVVELMHTLPDGLTVNALRDRLNEGRVDVVIFLGGDGTFAEVAKGVLAADERRPLGMLPAGTANDQGRSFGIRSGPQNLARNLDIIGARHITQLDVGRVRRVNAEGREDASELVFHSVGFGMQPDILAQRNEDKELVAQFPLLRQIYRDYAVYAGATLNRYLASWVEPTKFVAEVTADGVKRRYEGLTDLVINATPVYGGNWVLDRDAEPDDGRFEVVPVAGRREWASKALLDLAKVPIWQEHFDALGVSHTETFSAAEVEVELYRPEAADVPSQVDGEEWVDGNHFRLVVHPRLLPIITPKDWTPPWRPA
ncbi:MAG: hypothetical protein H6739_37735 [Alphaproteobacteria bacterium]|nr:hypothetical protein [Alphaproteobacteria bacterium]